jgi:hypothetical protein
VLEIEKSFDENEKIQKDCWWRMQMRTSVYADSSGNAYQTGVVSFQFLSPIEKNCPYDIGLHSIKDVQS